MRKVAALLFIASTAFGQDQALARLKHEMAVARAQAERDNKNGAQIAAVHTALRDWFEPQLPKDLYSLPPEYWHLEASLPTILLDAGLSKSDPMPDLDDPGFDEVGLDLKTMPELPDMLFVTATVHMQCGEIKRSMYIASMQTAERV
jgi:hypothetical protein